jgi:hypothetical protein
MSLPHAANATVPESKCTQYLLDIHHAEGGEGEVFWPQLYFCGGEGR